MLSIGERYSKQDVLNALTRGKGTVMTYALQVNGRIWAMFLDEELNPKCPKLVYVGTGPGRERSAEIADMQKIPFAVLIKKDKDVFEYIGDFLVGGASRDKKHTDPASEEIGRPVSRVLRLEAVEPAV
ncbi:hypothetical protein EON79_08680 [bacterium]|nr:MAG: hypothetical protein EON79_08680 [bacterium]